MSHLSILRKLFILKGVEETSVETTAMIKSISGMMADYKAILKPLFGSTYKHELLNNLFFHPYTKIEFICSDMDVQRKTGAKYLDMIVEACASALATPSVHVGQEGRVQTGVEADAQTTGV